MVTAGYGHDRTMVKQGTLPEIPALVRAASAHL